MNTSHLNALNVNLSNEKIRLETAQSEIERQMRRVWIVQLEKEVAAERAFLGLPVEVTECLSDDDLLAELLA